MRKFFRQTKGAVTVFVTMLLIPAILVSGTAVDLARIHTARSILQDANQMAANSVLTQYNALLYDLYGLFGVSEDDPVIGELLDEYIRVTVFGEEARDKSMGTLQLFYGSDLSSEGPDFAQGKTLRDEDVLRRQIEEYMKFRGPLIIVKEILEILDNNKLKEDAETINDKLSVDSDITELYNKCKELYDAIIAADKCNQAIGGIAGGSFAAVSSSLDNIRTQFAELSNAYSAWESTDGEEDPAAKSEAAAYYRGVRSNIAVLTTGGQRGTIWDSGSWIGYSNVAGLNNTVEKAKEQADNFKPKFDTVVDIAHEIDAMHDELARKVDALEAKLNSGQCSEEMRAALTEKQGTPPMSVIERYREILKWENIEGMAVADKDGGYRYIDNEVKPLLDGVKYRNVNNEAAGSLTRAQLAAIATNSGFALSGSVTAEQSKAAFFAGFPRDSVTYKMPPGFQKFSECPGNNKAFFDELEMMVKQQPLEPVKIYDGQENEKGADAEEKQENNIKALLNLLDTAYIGLANDPIGAKYITDRETAPKESLGLLGILTLIPRALSMPVIEVIHDPVGTVARAGDYLLLLTYCTSMFSNYSSARPESIGKTKDELDGIEFAKSIPGVPISPEVNYFFQSEWEYLYEGNDNAGKNLSAVTRLIFMLRLVCNYITVFSVSEVSEIVLSIQAAFAWCPPLGVTLGELARAAFAAAESLVDVAALRTGHKVPLIKNAAAGEWVCSPSGVAKAVKDIMKSEADGGDKDKDEKEKGLTYSNYMLFFFIAKSVFYIGGESDAATELAKRTGNLIEWNMINYKEKVNCDENKMAEALANSNRFRLADMNTDFSITTAVDLRMLFLSRVFARKYAGTKGLVLPTTIQITVTDYRGY